MQAVPEMRAEGGHVLAPARRHEGVQLGRRAVHGMDVAVDDLQPLVCSHLANGDIHGTSVSLLPGLPAAAAVSRKRG